MLLIKSFVNNYESKSSNMECCYCSFVWAERNKLHRGLDMVTMLIWEIVYGNRSYLRIYGQKIDYTKHPDGTTYRGIKNHYRLNKKCQNQSSRKNGR